jgi:hypothetical protein
MTPDRRQVDQATAQIKIRPEQWDETKTERVREIELVAQEMFAKIPGREAEALIAGFLKSVLNLAVKPSREFFESPKIPSTKLYDLDNRTNADYASSGNRMVPHTRFSLESTTALIQNLTGKPDLKVSDDVLEKYFDLVQDGNAELTIEWGRRVNFQTRIPGFAVSFRYITLERTPRVVEIIPALEIGLAHRLMALSTNRNGKSKINSNGQI